MSSEQVEVLIFGSGQGGKLVGMAHGAIGPAHDCCRVERERGAGPRDGRACRAAADERRPSLHEATDEKQGFIKALVVGSKADHVMAVVQTAMPRSAVFKHPTAIGCHLNRTMSRR